MSSRLLLLLVSVVVVHCLPEVIPIGGLFEKPDEEQELAFLYAVDQVNSDSRLLPRSRLAAKTAWLPPVDSFRAAKEACSLLRQGVAALVSPRSSAARHVVRSLAETFHIPHLEPREETRHLNPGPLSVDLYPLSTVLGKAYRDYVDHHLWKSVTVIYTQPEGLLRVQSVLQHSSRMTDAQAALQLNPPSLKVRLCHLRPHDSLKKVLKTVRGENNFIVDLPIEQVPEFLQAAQEMEMMSQYHNYFFTSLDLQTVDLSAFRGVAANVTGFRLVDPLSPVVQPVLKAWNFQQLRYGGSRTDRPLHTETALIYDAVTLLARALHDLDRVHVRTLDCDNAQQWSYGASIVNYIKMLPVEGLSGLIQFDANGQRSNFSLDIIELKSLGFIKTQVWTPEAGIQITRKYEVTLDEALTSLRSNVVRITTISTKPFYMDTGNGTYEGYTVDVVQALSERMGFNYSIHIVGDGQYGSYDSRTHEWNGMIRELIDKKADIAVADLTISYARERAVDFSYPFMNLGIGILIKKPTSPEKSMFSFLAPFSGEVWMYLATAYLGVSLIMYTLARLTPYEWTSPHPCDPDEPVLENDFNIANAFWFSIGSLMQQGSSVAPKAVSTRLIASVWWFFTLIIISSYTASLAAVLTSSRLQSPITTVEGLAKQRSVAYGCVYGQSTYGFFKSSNITTYKTMWEVMASTDPTVFTSNNEEGIERVLRGNYAFLMESTVMDYYIAGNCDLARIGDLLNSRSYGVATPQGSPFRDLFSKAVRELEETEVLDGLRNKWWSSDIKCEADMASMELNLAAVGGVFIILLAGVVLSLPVVVAEFCWRTKKVPRDRRGTLIGELWREIRLTASCPGDQRPQPPDDYSASSSTAL